jgi:hypothetical protein
VLHNPDRSCATYRVLASHLIYLPAAVFNCILLGVNHEKCDLSRLRDDHRG